MSKPFKVRAHSWIDGLLTTVEHLFDSQEEAVKHAKNSDGHHIKVYNENNELLQETISANNPGITNTYA